jgi:bacillithiol biosynthesis deacetylase BshB1
MNIAVLAAHPDDAELGLGATMALLASQGHRVLIIDATDGEPTPFGDPATRAAEAAEAARILGVERINLGWTNRAVTHDLASRHALAGQLRLRAIDVLFVPHPMDAHPDHLALSRIAIDARFDAKLTKSSLPGEPHHPRRLFHYFCTHLRTIPQPDLIVDAAGFEGAKMRSIAAYRSQFERNPSNREVPRWVEAMGRFYGSRIRSAFGEPITAPECVGVRDLAALLP